MLVERILATMLGHRTPVIENLAIFVREHDLSLALSSDPSLATRC
jgi:hypothetical protein